MKILDAIIVVVLLILAGLGLLRLTNIQGLSEKYERVSLRIDDKLIDGGRPMSIVEPLWWSVSIYDGPIKYEADLQRFSKGQRYVLAIMWYSAEVKNGGHHQFYSNSTGIVWRDARDGLQAIGMPEAVGVLRGSAEILGGTPSMIRSVREGQLASVDTDAFDKLDKLFYDKVMPDLDDKVLAYIKANRAAFYFDGTVRKPVP
jgi:hypothetical protein